MGGAYKGERRGREGRAISTSGEPRPPSTPCESVLALHNCLIGLSASVQVIEDPSAHKLYVITELCTGGRCCGRRHFSRVVAAHYAMTFILSFIHHLMQKALHERGLELLASGLIPWGVSLILLRSIGASG